MSVMGKRTGVLAAMLISSALSATMVAAQEAGSAQSEMARRVPVTILLTSNAGDAAVVLRRSHGNDADVVALQPIATGTDLLTALKALDSHRDLAGDHITQNATIRGRQSSTSATGIGAEHAADIVRRLQTAPLRDVEGFGRVRAITVYLPSQKMRDEAKRRRNESGRDE